MSAEVRAEVIPLIDLEAFHADARCRHHVHARVGRVLGGELGAGALLGLLVVLLQRLREKARDGVYARNYSTTRNE